MTGIYSISINNKRYIGQSINIKGRGARHLNDLRHGSHHSHKLQCAYDKYQEEPYFEILEECDESLLSEREKYGIDYYNTYIDGYNETPGGEAQQPGIATQKQVYVFNKQKELIKTYASARECSRELDIDQALLNKVLNGQRQHCATKDNQGYYYSYKNSCPEGFDCEPKIKCGKHKDYYVADKLDEHYQFDSGLAIMKFLHCSRHTLPLVGEVKNIHGYDVQRIKK